MSIFKIIKKKSKKDHRKIALVVGNKLLTYQELVNEVERVTEYFRKNKIKKNDKVGIVENNTIEFILIFLAISNVGAQAIPLNTSYTNEMIYQNFLKLKISHLFIWHDCLKYKKLKKMNLKNIITLGKKVKNIKFFNDYKNYNKSKKKSLNFLNKDFIITLTSGSTSNPKPIVMSQKTKLLRSIEAKKLYKINKNDVILTASPLDHSLGQRLLLLPLLSGGTSVVLSAFTTFNFYEAVKKRKISFAILVANQINELKKDKNKFNKLYLKKGLVSASAKLNNSLKKELIKKKIKVFEMYGASEIGTVTSIVLNKEKNKYKSVGKPCSKAKIKILSNENKFLPNNTVGEIVCSTPLKFKKYFGMDKQTSNSFYRDYFKTGDIGYLDKDNYLYYVGRKNNIIKISGINVFPEDIEKTIIKNSNITEIAVFGAINKKNKEEIIMCVVLKNNKIKKEMLYDYCHKKLATFQQPSYVFILNSLPKTTLGKINKPILKQIIKKKL